MRQSGTRHPGTETAAGPRREAASGQGRRRPRIAGVSLALLSTCAVTLIAVTSCVGAGFAWSPAPTPTPTSTPTATATVTPSPTATVTPSPTQTLVPTATPNIGIVLPPPGPEERWVLVDLSEQSTTAMVGDEPYHTAYGTTGMDGWETPIGEFTIIYRVENETMTSASIGAEEFYVLENVLYTQYFTTEGHALHLNYWRPDSVFGNERTSHGCVGLRYADAEFFWRFAGYGTRVVIQA